LAGDEQDLRRRRALERFISLADAFLVRNDVDRALHTLEEAESVHGPDPEVVRRLKLIRQRYFDEDEPPTNPPPSREEQRLAAQIELLRKFQRRIDERRRNA